MSHTERNAGEVTRILSAIRNGNAQVAQELLPLVYDELRRLATLKMAQEAPGQTLQPTALVHEAWLRLGGQENQAWNGRPHFFGAAAEAMRRILIDHARARNAVKRGGGAGKAAWHDSIANVCDLAANSSIEEVEGLDGAILRLEEHDSRAAGVVRLRFYAGLSVAEAARAMGVTERIVKRDWEYARAWLLRELRGRDGESGS